MTGPEADAPLVRETTAASQASPAGCSTTMAGAGCGIESTTCQPAKGDRLPRYSRNSVRAEPT
jgi:hypothetical protein